MNSRVEAIEPRCPTNLFERTPTSEQLKNTHYSASNRLSRLRAVATACQWPARCATSYGGLPGVSAVNVRKTLQTFFRQTPRARESTPRSACNAELKAREEQPEKAPTPIQVTESGMVIQLSEEQSRKAPSPIIVTEFGMVIEVSEEQSRKAQSPMIVTQSGRVIEGSEEQP